MDILTSPTPHEEVPNQNPMTPAVTSSLPPTSQLQPQAVSRDKNIFFAAINRNSSEFERESLPGRTFGHSHMQPSADRMVPSIDEPREPYSSRPGVENLQPLPNISTAAPSCGDEEGGSAVPKLHAMKMRKPASDVPLSRSLDPLFPPMSEEFFDTTSHPSSKSMQQVDGELFPLKLSSLTTRTKEVNLNTLESEVASHILDIVPKSTTSEYRRNGRNEMKDHCSEFPAELEAKQDLSTIANMTGNRVFRGNIKTGTPQNGKRTSALSMPSTVSTNHDGCLGETASQKWSEVADVVFGDLNPALPSQKPMRELPEPLGVAGGAREHSGETPSNRQSRVTLHPDTKQLPNATKTELYYAGHGPSTTGAQQFSRLNDSEFKTFQPVKYEDNAALRAHIASQQNTSLSRTERGFSSIPWPSGTATASQKPSSSSTLRDARRTTPCSTLPSDSAIEVGVSVIDDSDPEDAKPETTVALNPNCAKRPRSPVVIDLDDEEQMRSLSALPPLARQSRQVRPRFIPPVVLSGNTEAMHGTNRIHVSRGGGLFSVDAHGTVNIVDSDDESELQKNQLLISTAQGIGALPSQGAYVNEGNYSAPFLHGLPAEKYQQGEDRNFAGMPSWQMRHEVAQELGKDEPKSIQRKQENENTAMALGFHGTRKIHFTSSHVSGQEGHGGLSSNPVGPSHQNPPFELTSTEFGRQTTNLDVVHLRGDGPERDGLSERGLQTLMKQNEITADATAEAETPEGMNVSLMPHQKRALAWMIKREKPMHSDDDIVAVDEECLGGILADDQGLGKTLTMIALLLHSAVTTSQESNENESDFLSAGSSSVSEDGFVDDSVVFERFSLPWRTLVVCPPSLINQWKEELINRTEESHRPRICIYHGAKRERSISRLKMYDVVLTTYATLVKEYPKVLKNHPEWEMRKAAKLEPPCRARGPLCQVSWTRVVLDESQYIKNRSTESWNAVMSLDAERRWCLSGTPIQNCVDDLYALFCFIRYHFVRNYEMWNTLWKKKLESPFEHVRKRTFKQFQAITGVVLLRRTKLDEFNGKPLITLPPRTTEVKQLEFDGADESSFYHALAKKTVIRFNKFLAEGSISANYSNILLLLLRLRQASSHPFLIHYAQMQTRGHIGETNDTMYATTYAQEDLEEALELTSSGHSLLEFLDEKYRELIVDFLKPPPRGQAAALAFLCAFCAKACVWKNGTALPCGEIICPDCCTTVQLQGRCPKCNNSTAGRDSTETFLNVDHLRREVHAQTILGASGGTNVTVAEFKALLKEELRKRQRDEGRRGIAEVSTRNDDEDEFRPQESGEEIVRGIDTDQHAVSSSNQENALRKKRRFVRSKKKLLNALAQHSTKVRVIIEELDKVRESGNGEKTLIFSQWTSMLDIVEFHARVSGHDTCRLDGSMTVSARQKQIEEFRRSTKKNVFLISLHAGGTGLNLTASNRVILCDVWWNPAVEEQAIDRVHRIGQTRPVHVIRFRMKGTVEDTIYKICEKKRSMANGTLGEKGQQNLGRTKLARHELLSLFSGAAADVARNAGDDSAAVQAAQNILSMSN